MKTFLIISFWEFACHLKSRSFLLSTFVSPLIFAAIILFPLLFLDNNSSNQLHLIGCVEFDSTRISEEIIQRFNEAQLESMEKNLKLIKIQPDTSQMLRERFDQQERLKIKLDSLEEAYNQIKERRKYIFQKANTKSREKLLKQTYQQLIETREARDIAQLDFETLKRENDSLWQIEVIQKADDMLRKELIEGYLLIHPQKFAEGIVEFHSLLPSNFLQIQPVKQAVQVVIVEERLKKEGIRVDKIQEWLKPIEFREIQLHGEKKQEFDFMVNYLGPIIVVLFLFISIFSSSGFLFSGVLKEKTNRVIEILLSSVSHSQLVAGKIFGLGVLGIFQILIWYAIVIIFILLKILNVGEIGFLSIRYAALFLLYFALGYLFFASIFVGIGSLFSNEEDAHHLNQFMRMLSIFPIALALFVLESPNSFLVRILSFFPPLTPTFMILRTPLGNPPAMDYYISTGIMLASIILSILFAGKLFKIGSLMYGKKPSIREIFSLAIQKE